MSTQDERAKLIGSGSAAGLLAFCDFVVDKGYGTNAAVTPLKSAAKQVFSTVVGADKLGEIDVRALDFDDYMTRFENKKKGALKSESLAAYGARVRRILESYKAYLDDGRTPQIKVSPGTRRVRASNGTATSPIARAPTPSVTPSPVTDMVEYPFPLRSGTLASVRLPKRLERMDAERLAAFIKALVYEPQGELAPGEEGKR